MKKLVTDTPKSGVELCTNKVFGKDGWLHIHHDDKTMQITDFCLMLCKDRGCDTPDNYGADTDDRKDEMLCDCESEGCPIATVYAALSGFGHIRGRLKMYEDTGMMPPKERCTPVPFGYWENLARERGEKLKAIADVLHAAENDEAVGGHA